MKKYDSLLVLSATLLAAFSLVGCGDEKSADPNDNEGKDVIANSFDELPVCSASRECSVGYVKGEKMEYTCVDRKWLNEQELMVSGSCQKRPENGEDEAENPVFTAEDYLNSEIEYGTMIDPRDSSVYKTVKIGDKVWMAQNLGYGDDSIRAYGNATNFDSLNGHNYYANEAQLVCPEGWHLPRYNEFVELISFVDSTFVGTDNEDSVAVSKIGGKALKSPLGWTLNGGSNESGFSAVGSGYVTKDSKYGMVEVSTPGESACFWSSSGYSEESWSYGTLSGTNYDMFALCLTKDDDSVSLKKRNEALSVRCVKDE